MATEGADLYLTGDFFGGYNNSSPTSFVASTNVKMWSGESNAWQAMNGVSGGQSIWADDGVVGGGAYDSGVASIAVAGTDVFITGYWSTSGPGNIPGVNITHFSTNGTWLGTADYGFANSEGANPSYTGSSLITQNGAVYLGGWFLTFGWTDGTVSSTTYNSIAEWTNGAWQNLSSGLETAVNENPYILGTALQLAADATSVYVVGYFDTVGGATFNGYIASPAGLPSWSVTRWVTRADPDPCNCFTDTSSMSTARRDPTATLLPNGLVMEAGGYSSAYLSSAELYDWVTGTWTNTGSMSTALTFAAATLLPDGLVLVAGGQSSSPLTIANASLYNWETGTWTNTGSLNTAREYHTLTLLPNGLALAAGGWNGVLSEYLASAELYYPETGTWTNTGTMVVAGQSHSATLLPNGLVLVAGGANSSGALTNAELYNPQTATWTNTGALNTARDIHTATLLPNGLVLVAGGEDSSGNALASAELYNLETGTWTDTGSLNTARFYHTATLLGTGLVLVAGGTNSSGALTDAELYDPVAGVWKTICPLNTPRFDFTATLLPDGNVLAAGGRDSTNLSGAEVYNP